MMTNEQKMPGWMLRDLAHLHRVFKTIPAGALSWDQFLETRANQDEEAARREAEAKVWPPTSEQTCMNPACPRRGPAGPTC